MSITFVAENETIVGTALVVVAKAPEGSFVAVFEDDTETGYFYALDTSSNEGHIQDALLIYNVANVADKETLSLIKIGWSHDSKKVALLINDYPHAVFDFEARRAYCRTGFPPAPKGTPWGNHGHDWDGAAVGWFSALGSS